MSKTAFPGLGLRLAVALEAAGIDTVEKLAAVALDEKLLAVPGIETQAQVATIDCWLKLNNREGGAR